MRSKRRDQLAFEGSLKEYVERKVHVIVQFDEEYKGATQFTCPSCQTMFIIVSEPAERMYRTRSCPHCSRTARS